MLQAMCAGLRVGHRDRWGRGAAGAQRPPRGGSAQEAHEALLLASLPAPHPASHLVHGEGLRLGPTACTILPPVHALQVLHALSQPLLKSPRHSHLLCDWPMPWHEG